MHARINDVTVSPSRIDELGDVLSNKALPVVVEQTGCLGMVCAADRTTGNCAIVSFWKTRQALDSSEKAIASIRSATVDAVDATLNGIAIAEVLREVVARPSQVGCRSRAVRITAPAGDTDQMLEFYDNEAIPRLKAQPGFLNARLLSNADQSGSFAAVSHWTDEAALVASETSSAALRNEVSRAISGATVERVTTSEIILVHLIPKG